MGEFGDFSVTKATSRGPDERLTRERRKYSELRSDERGAGSSPLDDAPNIRTGCPKHLDRWFFMF